MCRIDYKTCYWCNSPIAVNFNLPENYVFKAHERCPEWNAEAKRRGPNANMRTFVQSHLYGNEYKWIPSPSESRDRCEGQFCSGLRSAESSPQGNEPQVATSGNGGRRARMEASAWDKLQYKLEKQALVTFSTTEATSSVSLEVVHELHENQKYLKVSVLDFSHFPIEKRLRMAKEVNINIYHRLSEYTGKKMVDRVGAKKRSGPDSGKRDPPPPGPPPSMGGGNAGAGSSHGGIPPDMVNTSLDHRNRATSRATLQSIKGTVGCAD
jgi:hypothetical protein